MVAGVISVSVGSTVSALVAIILGVLILIFPTMLRYLVGAYLLFVGVVGLLSMH